MKLFKTLSIFLLLQNIIVAQDAVHNFGAMQVHNGTSVGFHLDLVNDGVFNENLGLVGFYGYDKSITVSGTNTPVFYDSEILVDNNLYLETPIEILNNANLITGNIVTPRNNTDIHINFLNSAFYIGENMVSKVDGYAAITNKDDFIFPVGTEDRLRMLTLNSQATNAFAKCAYFYEDPNEPSTFNESFNTDEKETEFLKVNEKEFWHLEGAIPSTVTLNWDIYSNINTLGEFITDLKVVGWSKSKQQWVDLGNTDVQGGLTLGTLTSDIFVPNDYSIITIGGNNDILETYNLLELDNYYMTPNGDGVNDFLVIDGIEESPNNNLQIYNRYGVMVFSKNNYTNEFDGYSNRSSVITKNDGLASGIYFYIITLNDLRQKHQGYLYLTSNAKK
ncbi:gliding motility-associated C-terminal domain-containing protein [uncultured Maribacter sp.]|uniref:gliding motility-associated C-terminal domain-containing protein n=1 Tax=uncultured Maribacter sp. TaxID=431308 RepID=UPI00260BB01A|nr:gliding motility-associated C-terminal domain-containing protein [uncultured Maribacter sp.]